MNDGAIPIPRARKFDWDACGSKAKCAARQSAGRVPRPIFKGARDMARDIIMARDIMKSDEGQTSKRQRTKVEMLFAHLERILKLDRLRLRGPRGDRDGVLVVATAQNLRKLANLIPAPLPRTA